MAKPRPSAPHLPHTSRCSPRGQVVRTPRHITVQQCPSTRALADCRYLSHIRRRSLWDFQPPPPPSTSASPRRAPPRRLAVLPQRARPPVARPRQIATSCGLLRAPTHLRRRSAMGSPSLPRRDRRPLLHRPGTPPPQRPQAPVSPDLPVSLQIPTLCPFSSRSMILSRTCLMPGLRAMVSHCRRGPCCLCHKQELLTVPTASREDSSTLPCPVAEPQPSRRRHAICRQQAGRYLIVIDDVWSVPAWEAIRMRLPDNNCSSRIIVTTRIETVANSSSVSQNLVHQMKLLKLEDSKKLFIKRVFGSMGGSGTCPQELTDTMDKILKKCGGLPLAIVSIASLLASYNSAESVEMWQKVSKSIGSQMESHPTMEGMRQMMTLSYDYLPHRLKACMMYLSIFPEDYVIAKNRLLYRWIAEGLVAEKRGLTLFDVAEEYFNELISRNMIQPDKLLMGRESLISSKNQEQTYTSYNQTMEACRVHDILLEIIVSKSQEANFVSLVQRHYGGGLPHGKVRRLSIHGNDDYDEHSSGLPHKKEVEQRGHRARHGGIEAMNLQHLRSLTTFQSEGLGLDKLLDRLGEFKLLRVLDLENCKAMQDKHMRDVCRLYLLRLLSLRNTAISVMPSEVGDLEYLTTLNVGNTNIINMPQPVTKLSKLESMRVPQWVLPYGLGNMKALREVDFAYLKSDVKVAREIGELQQLQKLSINFSMEEHKEEILQALGSSLSKTCALRCLHLNSNSTLDFLLHVSSPPQLLWHLSMAGSISRLPDWITSLKHLAEFSVKRTKLDGNQVLDSLCRLPSLQSIELGNNSCRDQELVVRTTHKFPALRILDLNLATEYPEVVKFEEGSMTKLETLLLNFYTKERSIVGIGNLKNLKEVKLSGDKKNSSMEDAVWQLKEENKNRPEPIQIKVVRESLRPRSLRAVFAVAAFASRVR